ncbi:MBL fold metallo-hydrolase [Actinomadura atramentaria]|uniref:MBL fold metallo-hydrolase n=1 Tax=Actinomadura atramentaria TaxID=1990 RepID=UPI0003651D57|nr:MBL fold metallo-hydrolase [Actinomadura atramentaria]
MRGDAITEVTKDVFLVAGTSVNWVLLRDGDDLTLVDGGYPGDADAVEESIRALGRRPEDVRAILLTHAHVDHVGALVPFHRRYGTPALCDPREVGHARREYLEQLTPGRLVANLWRPGVLPWALGIVRAGATRDAAVPHVEAFAADGPLDLPGAPVPVPTPGHTSGHTAFHLPAAGAIITGDALITGHALTRLRGPQLIPRIFDHGPRSLALAGLDPLAAVAADVILPGHGPAHETPLATAVAQARAHG